MATLKQIVAGLDRLGVSEAALCRRADLNQVSFVRWKQGKQTPRPKTWQRVEDAFAAIKAERTAQ